MDTHWIWWLLALAVIVAELATGTVYLLMLAVGLAVGGFAAYLGQHSSVQLWVAAAVTAAGCFAVQRRNAKRAPPADAQRNADIHIDLGNSVHVDAWSSDCTATVQYRGARWQAVLDAPQSLSPATGKYRIVGMNGSTLVLASAMASIEHSL